MTSTAGHLPRRLLRWVVIILAIDAVIVWAVAEVFGSPTAGLTGLVGALCPLIWTWRSEYRTPAMRREQEVTARALADHRDPGPEHRAAVDSRARVLLAGPRADEWLPAAFLLALAVACVVAAVVRADGAAAVPAVPLVLAAVLVTVVLRRRLLAASRWLEDPPYERAPQ